MLSQPDIRDYSSLPPADIGWSGLERSLKGVRIGLLRHAGCGMDVHLEVQAAIEAAAKLFEAAGALVEPMEP